MGQSQSLPSVFVANTDTADPNSPTSGRRPRSTMSSPSASPSLRTGSLGASIGNSSSSSSSGIGTSPQALAVAQRAADAIAAARLASSESQQAARDLNLQQADAGHIGLTHWEQQRAQWAAGHRPYNAGLASAEAFKSHPNLFDVDDSHYTAIYTSLVNGRRFSKTVPLSFVITILIHGWRQDGLVPPDWPPQLQLHALPPPQLQGEQMR
ncbi:hypothetical protein BC831DRAFT_443700 [Entophlyctis helioformis]|nr:hypothetical protein BC831DRAFT_443700 [Entophlyctis helioformis]